MVEHGNAACIRELGIEVLEFHHFKPGIRSVQWICTPGHPFLLQRFQLLFQLFIVVGEFIVPPVVFFLILRMNGIVLQWLSESVRR